MESKKHQIRLLQGCLFMWIAVLLTLGGDTSTVAAGDSTMATDATATATVAPKMDSGILSTVPATMPPPGASMNPPPNGTMMPPPGASMKPRMPPVGGILNCNLLHCMGNVCAKNQSAIISPVNSTCSGYCEYYRYNSSYFETRCNDHCMHHMCNTTLDQQCSLICCNLSDASNCTTAEELNHGNTTANPMVNKTVTPTTTTTTPTTTKAIVYSDKVCRSFTCSGTDCYKNSATAATKQCQVGIIHCELQKKVTNGAVSYEAGCSNTCATSTKSCATITTADCFQECCNATNTGCCMKLDGQVHFNTATEIHKGSMLKILTCAVVVIFFSRYFSSSRV
ncbi:uncharacterized protein [Hyperolius riggenbachi]|uniref:uncharacterized protein isoform X2 n=1 Tax=Hyperolius riggenbachi TaxID=752182 RepID=UPI0035A38277